MKKKVKAIGVIFLLLLVGIVGYALYYVNDYYHAEVNIQDYNNTNVKIIPAENGLLLDGEGNDSAIIFYPGAKVEYTSYVPLCYELSENGVDCFIVNMPFNMAILGKDNAKMLMANDSYHYDNWYMAGHSLGGTMAADYAGNHKEVKGLILLASYSTSKVTTPTLSIICSEDKVLNKNNYEENRKNIQNLSEYTIEGGNHAGFAYYGMQEGDGQATITKDKQINTTANEILSFLNKSI